MNLSIPIRSFFDFAWPCPRLEGIPFMKGPLTGWPERHKLPDLGGLEGADSFAEVYLGWRDEGLYIGVDVQGKAGLKVEPKRPLKGDGIQVWVDTRDVRDAHRASRFCHHFFFLPGGGRRKGAAAGQVRIRRARSQGKPCEPQAITVVSKIRSSGYRLSAHLPADVLHGFDPEDNTRIGFTYRIADSFLGLQSWAAEDPLPVSYDPSLWGTLQLVD